MSITSDEIQFIIPFTSSKKDKNKHYIKAQILNTEKSDAKLDDVMDNELMYGDIDYFFH